MPAHLMMAWAGLQQVASPSILAQVFCLLIVLFFISQSRRQMVLLGLVMTSSIFLGSMAVRLMLDVVLAQILFPFNWFYLGLGIIFLYFGLGFFWDWIQCFRFNARLAFLKIVEVAQSENWILLTLKVLLVVVLGLLLGLVGVHLTPEDQRVIYADNMLILPGQWFYAASLLMAYELGVVSLLLLLLGVVFWLSKIDKLNSILGLSWSKMILSACYISVGVSLIYLY